MFNSVSAYWLAWWALYISIGLFNISVQLFEVSVDPVKTLCGWVLTYQYWTGYSKLCPSIAHVPCLAERKLPFKVLKQVQKCSPAYWEPKPEHQCFLWQCLVAEQRWLVLVYLYKSCLFPGSPDSQERQMSSLPFLRITWWSGSTRCISFTSKLANKGKQLLSAWTLTLLLRKVMLFLSGS